MSILDTLEFNALHSEHGGLTKAVFKVAAAEIRQLRNERDHWRRMVVIEEAGTRTARADAKRMEQRLRELMEATEDHAETQQARSQRDESPVPEGDAPNA